MSSLLPADAMFCPELRVGRVPLPNPSAIGRGSGNVREE
jgi:hypothetical protein